MQASAMVIMRFFQYRKLVMMQKSWFESNAIRSKGGLRARGHSVVPVNMLELNASRLSYRKSLANLKRNIQVRCYIQYLRSVIVASRLPIFLSATTKSFKR